MSHRFHLSVLLSALLALTGACGKKSSDTKPLPKSDTKGDAAKRDDRRSVSSQSDEGDGEDEGEDGVSDDDDTQTKTKSSTKTESATDTETSSGTTTDGDMSDDDGGDGEQVIKSEEPPGIPVWRFYNATNGDHYYTLYETDFPILQNAGYTKEGIGFYSLNVMATGAVPVYRWYAPTVGDHFLTIQNLASIPGYNKEGIAFYVRGAAADGFVPLNRYLRAGFHFYTVETAVAGWAAEGNEGFVKTAP